MSRRFAHRDVGPGAPAESGAGTLERQQATLLELLSDKEGAPVSFAELQQAGIEFPASVVSELELAGAPIERCVLDTRDAHAAGVRLNTARASNGTRAARGAGASSPDARPTPAERARERLHSSRWLAPVALLAALGVISALALGELTTSSGRAPDAFTRSRPHRPPALSAAAHSGSRHAPTTRTAHGEPPPLPATPVSETLATQLEAHGHELLESGRYSEAIPTLTSAVTATGEHLEACLQPATETCLTYAYALYDLGRALQLDGHPAAAVGVLARRLQIDNQRSTVAVELQRARAQAG